MRLVTISKDGEMLACTSNYGVIASVLDVKQKTVPSILSKAEKKDGEYNGYQIDFLPDKKMVAHCGILGIRIDTGTDEILCDKCCFKNSPIDCINSVDCEIGSYYYTPRKMTKEEFILKKIRSLPKLQFKVNKTLFGFEAIRDNSVVDVFDTEQKAIECLKELHKESVLKYLSKPKKRYFYRGILLANGKDAKLNQVLARRIIDKILK